MARFSNFSLLSCLITSIFILFLISCSKEQPGYNTFVKSTQTLQQNASYNGVVFELSKLNYDINQEALTQVLLYNSRGFKPVAFQFDITYNPETVKIIELLPGDAIILAGKELNYNKIRDGVVRLIVFGFNQNIIEDGEVIKIRLMPLNTNPDIKITQLVVSDPEGKEVSSFVK